MGKKPSKQNRSHGRPEFTNAGISAVGPGSVSTSMPASMQVRASKKPGSLMPGVPASLISATDSPARILSLTRAAVSCSFHLW